ncbi:MAG: twin-arginine translocation signal domain-containing protein, partial [Prolixibacteraceae bacterium]|nr:twin-arginine translocation signal domain-containing protein [Prolixibacteraceae bacterium]
MKRRNFIKNTAAGGMAITSLGAMAG